MKRLLALAALFVALHAGAVSTAYVDYSGTITLGGTSQTLRAAVSNGGRVAITNPTTETEVLCVNATSAASCTAAGSWQLKPGETLTLDTDELITINAATTGHKFTAKRVTEGFAGAGPGAGSGGGGGDATAANQVTTNSKLDILHADITASNSQLPTSLGPTTAANSLAVTLDTTVASANASTAATRVAVSLNIADPVTGTAAAAGVLSNMPFAVGKGAQSVIVNVTANTATANFEFSTDGTAAYAAVSCWLSSNSGTSSSTSSTATTGVYICPVLGTHFQVRQSSAGGVTATVAPTARGSINTVGANIPATLAANVTGPAAHDAAISGNPVRIGGRALTADYTPVATGDVADLKTTTVGALIEKPFAIPEHDWTYAAAASGISNTTTAVTFKAATGNAATRSYITGIQYYNNTLGAATELAIRDGAGGTVLWRTSIGTTIGRENITFMTPIRSSLNTLLEVVTLTAVTGNVYFNAQGYDAP